MVIPLDESFDNQTWIIGNLKHSGFYRVNYNKKNWKLLIDQLKTNHHLIDATSRAQLIDDSFNLGRAEIIDQLDYLEIISYLLKEDDPLPFLAAFNGLNYIDEMISSNEIGSDFNLFKVKYIYLYIKLYQL